jgi:hypothetical protein
MRFTVYIVRKRAYVGSAILSATQRSALLRLTERYSRKFTYVNWHALTGVLTSIMRSRLDEYVKIRCLEHKSVKVVGIDVEESQ